MVADPTAVLFILAFTVLAPLAASNGDSGTLPKFVENVPNITVTVGSDAILPCTVEQLNGFKVAWVRVDTQIVLTIHKQVITRNPRITLLHNDPRTWHLQLKNVRESDRGWYVCQMNTDPMRSRQGYVDVVVPPDIIDRDSSGDLTVREGQDVTLTCRAKGHPTPSIIWRREDNQDIVLDAENTDLVGIEGGAVDGIPRMDGSPGRKVKSGGSSITSKEVKGEVLVLKNVSRLQMGSYLCSASNGVPPSISKRVNLIVRFPPMAWVPQQLEGAYVGQELTIECHTEAFPKSINYWTNTNGYMIVADDRYEPMVTDTSYKVYMKLRIKKLEPQDFGTFKCVAKNSIGQTDAGIKIYEIDPPKSHLNAISGPEDHTSEVDNTGFEVVTTPASDAQNNDPDINSPVEDGRRPGYSGSTSTGEVVTPTSVVTFLMLGALMTIIYNLHKVIICWKENC